MWCVVRHVVVWCWCVVTTCGVWLREGDLVEIRGVLEVVFWLHVEWCCCVYGREDLWGGVATC